MRPMLDIIYRYDPHSAENVQPPGSVAEARQRLEQGNRRFAHLLEIDPHADVPGPQIIHFSLEDLGIELDGSAPKQQPYAVVLGCSDARVPTEMVFSEACNSLFVVRVAGNVLGSECLGSVDYAVQHFGHSLKLILVLAHSGCGAVTAAVDAFIDPARYLAVATSHPVRAIVDRIIVPVRAGAQSLERVWGDDVVHAPGYRRALIETAVPLSAALTAAVIEHEHLDSDGSGVEVFFSVYDLASRHVRVPMAGLSLHSDDEVRLVKPPSDPAEIANLAMQLAGSDYIRELLPQRNNTA